MSSTLLTKTRVYDQAGAGVDEIRCGAMPRTTLSLDVDRVQVLAVAWITVNAFGERTEYEPQSPSDPIFFLRRPRGDTAHMWRLFRSRHDAIAYMREHFGRDPEALEWAEHLPVQDYEELIGGRPGACS